MTNEEKLAALMWLEFALDDETCQAETGKTVAECVSIAHSLIQGADPMRIDAMEEHHAFIDSIEKSYAREFA